MNHHQNHSLHHQLCVTHSLYNIVGQRSSWSAICHSILNCRPNRMTNCTVKMNIFSSPPPPLPHLPPSHHKKTRLWFTTATHSWDDWFSFWRMFSHTFPDNYCRYNILIFCTLQLDGPILFSPTTTTIITKPLPIYFCGASHYLYATWGFCPVVHYEMGTVCGQEELMVIFINVPLSFCLEIWFIKVRLVVGRLSEEVVVEKEEKTKKGDQRQTRWECMTDEGGEE